MNNENNVPQENSNVPATNGNSKKNGERINGKQPRATAGMKTSLRLTGWQ